MQESTIIIFSRTLVAGKVKTRIAASLGNDKALAIHLRLFNQTRHAIRSSGYPHIIYLSETPMSPPGFEYKLQVGKDLGERMHNCLSQELKTSEKVCLIGTDCLDLRSSDIKEAFEKLNAYDIVIGPAFDGGYYLIGMRKPTAKLFETINWGQSTVLVETLRICERMNLNYYLLEERKDVDRVEDIPPTWL